MSDTKIREEKLTKTGEELIVETLTEKAGTKQKVFRQTSAVFQDFKEKMRELQVNLHGKMGKIDRSIEVSFRENGTFEAELKLSGDILIFSMHTNVFTFDSDHFIHKSAYIEENRMRAYCGMIQVYNFLGDSFKYNRTKDIGYLVARIFINSEYHFFVEGKRQLGFLYNDFENAVLSDNYIRAIIESVVLYALDFDLLAPPYDQVKELTVLEKIEQLGLSAVKTGKRLGFRFEADSDRVG